MLTEALVKALICGICGKRRNLVPKGAFRNEPRPSAAGTVPAKRQKPSAKRRARNQRAKTIHELHKFHEVSNY